MGIEPGTSAIQVWCSSLWAIEAYATWDILNHFWSFALESIVLIRTAPPHQNLQCVCVCVEPPDRQQQVCLQLDFPLHQAESPPIKLNHPLINLNHSLNLNHPLKLNVFFQSCRRFCVFNLFVFCSCSERRASDPHGWGPRFNAHILQLFLLDFFFLLWSGCGVKGRHVSPTLPRSSAVNHRHRLRLLWEIFLFDTIPEHTSYFSHLQLHLFWSFKWQEKIENDY